MMGYRYSAGMHPKIKKNHGKRIFTRAFALFRGLGDPFDFP